MNGLDLSAMGLYAVILIWMGIHFARRPSRSQDFALGGRALPTWAVLLSMSATELSAATFIGVPHAAYTGDWTYLQLGLGALLGKILLAWKIIPLYYRSGVVTVYGFLADRFGSSPQQAAALCFLIGRLLASGARLFIASLALAAVSDIPLAWAIVGCGLIAAAYTLAGGIKAVVWTDTLQAGLLLFAALAVLASLIAAAPGGFAGLWEWAEGGGRTRIALLDPLLSLDNGRVLGTALIGAFFLTLASHATDHDMVQRLLTTRNAKGGSQALLGSALLNFPLTLLCLALGTGLASFYQAPPAYDISDQARIFPLYALHELPAGLRGLVFAGLFAAAMSSLDSAICAMATCWCNDIRPEQNSDSAELKRMRLTSVVVSGGLITSALAMSLYHAVLTEGQADQAPNLVEFALSAMSIVYGGLLGVFALGFVSKTRGSSASVCTALAIGTVLGLILFLHPVILGQTWIAWPWWIPISATVTLTIAASSRRPLLSGSSRSDYPAPTG
ncbi:MAG: hypothetical protein VX252_02750 [Myxococcota bacterium]|nr:hypothetical protein [Myxococcota bacterium]